MSPPVFPVLVIKPAATSKQSTVGQWLYRTPASQMALHVRDVLLFAGRIDDHQ